MQYGDTALLKAAKNGFAEIVTILLAYGAKIEHQDKVIRVIINFFGSWRGRFFDIGKTKLVLESVIN